MSMDSVGFIIFMLHTEIMSTEYSPEDVNEPAVVTL